MADLLKADQSSVLEVPALIAGAGERAAWRFAEFFTVNIPRQEHPRRVRLCRLWISGLVRRAGHPESAAVEPVHVATYVEGLERELSVPSLKPHLACIRMLFDWLVTGQVVPTTPAHAVRGPRYSVSKGSTRVITSSEATALLQGMDVSHVVGLRDRTLSPS